MYQVRNYGEDAAFLWRSQLTASCSILLHPVLIKVRGREGKKGGMYQIRNYGDDAAFLWRSRLTASCSILVSDKRERKRRKGRGGMYQV